MVEARIRVQAVCCVQWSISLLYGNTDRCACSHPDLVTPKRALAVAVVNLALETWDAQAAEVQAEVGEPSFISDLRLTRDGILASKRPKQTLVGRVSKSAATDSTAFVNSPAFPMDDADGGGVYGLDWAFWDQLMKDPDLLRIETP